ncbi:MAG: DUF421 domain-containing protein [Clostridiales bacterium]|nr:DUF421 domain-containing protein [Clostridiales bacterium]
MEALLVYAARCVVMVLVIWAVSIVLGKKSLLQFSAFDIGILMIVSTVIAQPLVTKDVVKTAVGVVILLAGIIVIGKLSLRSRFYMADYRPSVLIAGGVIKKEELRKNHMSIHALLALLRAQGYTRVSDVNFAILELGGNISVVPRNSARPVTVRDMGIPVPDGGLTLPVVMDGVAYPDMLEAAGVTLQWLEDELKKRYRCVVADVFYAETDGRLGLYVNLYSQSGEGTGRRRGP